MSELLFLNNLLEDISVEREPKFSSSSGTGSASPWEAADRDPELRCRGSCQKPGVRSLNDRCCVKSSTGVRFRVLGEIFTADCPENLATGAEILLPWRTHEHAKDVNIFTSNVYF